MKLLVPTAGPNPAKQNAKYVIELARKLRAELDVVHILDLAADRGPGDEALRIFKQAGNEKGVPVRTHLVEGNVVPTIVDMAEDLGSNLIVMGAKGHSALASFLLGSVTEKTLLHMKDVPLLVVRPPVVEKDTVQAEMDKENLINMF